MEVSNFVATTEEMYFELDNGRFGDFIVTAVATGLVKAAFRLTGMIYKG